MRIEQFDIVLARVRFKLSNDARPCLVLEDLREGRFPAFAISSSRDLTVGLEVLELGERSNDFAATGLKRTSFVLLTAVVLQVELAAVIRRLGRLEGELLQDFNRENWFGT